RSARLPPPRGISRQAVRRCTAVSIVAIVATVGKVIAANPLRLHLWPPGAGNHPTAPAGVGPGLHKRHISAFRAIPATDVAPGKRAATRLIRLRAPSNVQSSQTRRYVADEQYLADQSHGPSRSKEAEIISGGKTSGNDAGGPFQAIEEDTAPQHQPRRK